MFHLETFPCYCDHVYFNILIMTIAGGFHNTGSNEGLANKGQSEDSEPDLGGEESDSSEDEVHFFFLLPLISKNKF